MYLKQLTYPTYSPICALSRVARLRVYVFLKFSLWFHTGLHLYSFSSPTLLTKTFSKMSLVSSTWLLRPNFTLWYLLDNVRTWYPLRWFTVFFSWLCVHYQKSSCLPQFSMEMVATLSPADRQVLRPLAFRTLLFLLTVRCCKGNICQTLKIVIQRIY